MKIFSVVLLVIGLALTSTLPAMAEIHPAGSDFLTANPNPFFLLLTGVIPKPEQWFTIKDAEPGIYVNLQSYSADFFSNLNINFQQNDQMFIGLDQLTSNGVLTELYGNYLFNNGIFIGFVNKGGLGTNDSLISGGYRLSLNDKSYVAFSIDERTGNDPDGIFGSQEGVYGYEVCGKYFLDNAKLFGEVYIFRDTTVDPYLMVGGNLALTDNLTTGLKLEKEGDFQHDYIGLTWSKDRLTLNGSYGMVNEEGTFHYLAVGGSYQIQDGLAAGLSYSNFGTDPTNKYGYQLSIHYKTGFVNFGFYYNHDYFDNYIPTPLVD